MTQTPRITIVAAFDEGNVIGNGSDIPWHLPEDFKHFKNYTTGKTIVLGRKTFESIGRPLPDRRTVVVTLNDYWCYPGVVAVSSLEEAISSSPGEPEIVIAGGGEVYAQALPLASGMVLSRVEGKHDGDVFFPEVDWSQWLLEQVDYRDSFAIEYYVRSEPQDVEA